MGQTISELTGSGEPSVEERVVDLDNNQLENLFVKKCASQLKQIELFAIKSNLNINDLNLDTLINEKEFARLVNLEGFLDEKVLNFLFSFLLTLSEFPVLSKSSPSGSINVVKLLKLVNLINSDRFNAIFNKEFDHTKLLLIALSLSGEENDQEKNIDKLQDTQGPVKAKIVGNKLQWSSIDFYKDLDIDNLSISVKNLSLIFAFCLSISAMSIDGNHYLNLSQFRENFEAQAWRSYEKVAMSLIRSIDYDAVSTKSLLELKIPDICRLIETTFPNIFAPLSHMLNSLLLLPQQKELHDIIQPTVLEETGIINAATLAQLATFLPIEICYSKMRKLYIGKESGFSMRSFESKVMKWNAPTILFVSGSRINPLKKKLSKGAETFINDEYPKFKMTSNSSYGSGSEKLTFGVYVHQPWKLSNKETFGDSRTTIFQLSPQQQLFQASGSSQKYVYFSTFNNSGIGFGCELPLMRNGMRRFQPGNVSLLIDGGLEFCSFRHIGPGGTFLTGSAFHDVLPEYEDKFVISDLEVYGVGSDKEIQEQLKQWEWEKKEAEARQRVNLRNLGEERLFLEMAGLVGNTGSGGSI